jgi:TonB family protein
MNDVKKSNGKFPHDPYETPGDASADDAELRALLECWQAPAPSHALDSRVMNAYRNEISSQTIGAGATRDAVPFSQERSEVAKMKECPTCREAFADKFVFCPTDGTPLNELSVNPIAEEDATVDSANANPVAASDDAFTGDEFTDEASSNDVVNGGVPARPEYQMTMLQDTGIIHRLGVETREFKNNPKAYAENLNADFNAFVRRPMIGMALGAAFLLLAGFLGTILLFGSMREQIARDNPNENLEVVGEFPMEIPEEQPTPKPGNAGEAKGKGGGSKPKQEKPGGGGGGGRVDSPPEVSQGKRPLATLKQPQVLAPKPEPPTIKNPSLPTLATVRADDVLFPPDRRPLPYGVENSSQKTPSAGRGEGDGMGGGSGAGFGRGEGRGVGPGEGENTGGGRTRLGGGGAGGGGEGGAPKEVVKEVYSTKELTKRISIVSKPEPGYTEEARKNSIQGTVTLRVLFASNGSVSSVTPLKRLPDGLTEKAIAAAKQIKFVPAEKDGRKVSTWGQVNYAFNIY